MCSLTFFSLTRKKDGDDDGVRMMVEEEAAGSHIPVLFAPFGFIAAVLRRQVTSVLMQLSLSASVCALSSVIIFSTVLRPIKFSQLSHFQEYTLTHTLLRLSPVSLPVCSDHRFTAGHPGLIVAHAQ